MKKIFILFGPTGDLGKAAVKYFLEKEFDYYYFISRKKIKIDSSQNNHQTIITGDLSKEQNVAHAFSKIEKDSSNTYFLFNTIGGYFGGKNIWDTDFENWEKMMNINLTASFLIAKHFSKLIIGTGGGSICLTSALSGFKNEKGKIAYGLSKNGVNFLIKSLALEGKDIGLTANAVAPQIIDTPANREWITYSSQLVSTKKIFDTVYHFFSNHPEISGEIVRLIK